MFEPKWQQKRPSSSEIKQMWQELRIAHEPMQNPAIETLLHHLRTTHVNGGAEFACFRLSEHSAFHWFGSRNRLDEIDFFNHFLRSPVVADTLPVLKLHELSVPELEFKWNSTFSFDGELAETLVWGGAYNKFNGSPEAAKQIASQFCDALFEGRYTEVQMYKSHAPLTKWFYDIAWDKTWIGFDKRTSNAWLLCITDVD